MGMWDVRASDRYIARTGLGYSFTDNDWQEKHPNQTWENPEADLINLLPVSTSQGAAEQRKLQGEYLQVRNEMNATSSQDEFAKWAKLRRKHDKLLEQLEAKSTISPHLLLCLLHMCLDNMEANQYHREGT